jgi:phosphatidylglycerophosphate synthase
MNDLLAERRLAGRDARHHLAANGALFLAIIAAAIAAAVATSLPAWLAIAATTAVSGSAIWRFRRSTPGTPDFGHANRVTLFRVNLTALMLLPVMWAAAPGLAKAWSVFALAATALLLDGVDGWLARRRAEASRFGARFDMAADTVFLIVLTICLAGFGLVGPWVLAIGLLRPLFVAARLVWAPLAAPLPPSRSRKVACGSALALLVAALAPPLAVAAPALAGAALAMLLWSFARDMRRLLAGLSPPA